MLLFVLLLLAAVPAFLTQCSAKGKKKRLLDEAIDPPTKPPKTSNREKKTSNREKKMTTTTTAPTSEKKDLKINRRKNSTVKNYAEEKAKEKKDSKKEEERKEEDKKEEKKEEKTDFLNPATVKKSEKKTLKEPTPSKKGKQLENTSDVTTLHNNTNKPEKEPDMETYEKLGPPTDDTIKKRSEKKIGEKSVKSQKSYRPPPADSRPKVPENQDEIDHHAKNTRSLELIKDEPGFE